MVKKQSNTPVVVNPVKEGVTDTPVVLEKVEVKVIEGKELSSNLTHSSEIAKQSPEDSSSEAAREEITKLAEKEIPGVENPTGEGTTIDKTAGELLNAEQLLELAGNKPIEVTEEEKAKWIDDMLAFIAATFESDDVRLVNSSDDETKVELLDAEGKVTHSDYIGNLNLIALAKVASDKQAEEDKDTPILNPNTDEVQKAVDELEADIGEIPSDYDITLYNEQAGRTAAPAKSVATALQLITNDPNVVVNKSKIAALLIDIMEVANKADIYKRATFYGDPKVQTRLSKQQGVIESLRERVNHGDLDFTDEQSLNFLHAIWGIQSEVGEIAEELINSKAEKRALNALNMKEELGDIMWYMAIMLRQFGTFFQNVAESNINKLMSRYPDKFDASKALNRDLNKEKDALNS